MERQIALAQTLVADTQTEAPVDTFLDNNEGRETEEVCPICRELIPAVEVARPDGCSHAFCIRCLYIWKRCSCLCPCCRQVFRNIRPVGPCAEANAMGVWYAGGEGAFAFSQTDLNRSSGTDEGRGSQRTRATGWGWPWYLGVAVGFAVVGFVLLYLPDQVKPRDSVSADRLMDGLVHELVLGLSIS